MVVPGSSLAEARRHEEAAAAAKMLELRVNGEAAFFDELHARLVTALVDDDPSRVAVTSLARNAALAELREGVASLADGDGKTAVEASSLLITVDRIIHDLDEQEPTGHQLYEMAGTVRFAERAADTPPRTGLDQLTTLAALGPLTLNSSLDAEIVISGADAPVNLTTYFAEAEGAVSDNPGWLGTEPGRPVDAELFELDAVRAEYSDEMQTINDVLAASKLPAADRWVRSFADGNPDDAPFTIEAIADSEAAASATIRTIVRGVLADEQAAHAAAAGSARSRVGLLRIIAGLLSALASIFLALIVRVVVKRLRRSQERARLASMDRLTAVGNRHELEERTSVLIADPRFAQHVVAVIDMDRFKLINDTWGHSAGDAVLVEVARGLTQMARRFGERHPGSETTVVRMGGDEFLCSLHSRESFDIDSVHRELEAIRSMPLVTDDGVTLPLEFSIGVAVCDGPAVMYDMISAADLAAYEQKSARAACRPNHSATQADLRAGQAGAESR